MLYVYVIYVLNILIIFNYLYMYMDYYGIMVFIVYIIIYKKNIEKYEKVFLRIIIRCNKKYYSFLRNQLKLYYILKIEIDIGLFLQFNMGNV